MMLPDNLPERGEPSLILALLFALFFLLIFTSCGASRTVVRGEAVRTEYRDRLRESRDSIYLQDSIYIYSSGDTVYRDRWRYRYRDRILRDTVYLHKIDSVYVETQVRKSSSIASLWTIVQVISGVLVLGALLALILKVARLWR